MLETYKATATGLPDGLQVATQARNFKLTIDEPVSSGGTDIAMSPVEALLCAFGACQTIVAKSFAQKNNFTFKDFHVEIEGDLDPEGFMGNPDIRNGFQEIRFTMHFDTEESQEKTEAFADFIQNTCPVGDNLMNGVKLVRSGVVRDNTVNA